MSSGVSAHRYPRSTVRAALWRATAGAGFCLLALFATGPTPVGSLILVPLFLLFLFHGWRTFDRGARTLHCDATGLRWDGQRATMLRWIALTDLKLAYYTTRRDGEDGWMELTVAGDGTRIVLESELSGFADVVARSVAAARDNGIPISATSQRNLSAVLDRSGSRQSTYASVPSARAMGHSPG